jgi:hypothetical protein
MERRHKTLEEIDRAFAAQRRDSSQRTPRRGRGKRAGAVLLLLAAGMFFAAGYWCRGPVPGGSPPAAISLRADGVLRRTASLTLTQASDTQTEAAFPITVTLKTPDGAEDTAAYAYSVDGADAGSLRSGETLALQSGQKAVIRDLPADTEYTAYGASAAGYVLSGMNDTGSVGEEGAFAAFTAQYAEQSLRITFALSNADGTNLTEEQREEEFSFTAVFSGEGAPEEQSFTLKHGEEYLFEAIPAGVSYRIIQTDIGEEILPSVTEYEGTAAGGEAVLPFANVCGIPDADASGSLTVSRAAEDTDDIWYAYSVTFSGEDAPEEQLFRLRDGMEAVLEGLPIGIRYTASVLYETGNLQGVRLVKGVINKASEALFS